MKLAALMITMCSPLLAVWPNGYTYKSTYTVKSSQITGTLTNFTVVIAGTVADYKTVGNGGKIEHTCSQTLYGLTIPADFIFTSDSDGAVPVGWQWDTYAAATGAHTAHVIMPSAAVGTVLYGWYGNAGVSTCQGGSASATWDSNTKFASIYPDGSSLSIADYIGNSTTNTNGVTAVSGMNSGMANFVNASSQYIDAGNNARLDITGAITLEAWIRVPTVLAIDGHRIISKLEGTPNFDGYELYLAQSGVSNDGCYLQGYAGAADGFNLGANATIGANTLVYCAASYDGTNNGAVYQNASLTASSSSIGAGKVGSSSQNLNIGAWPGNLSDAYFNGDIGEAVVSATVRSAAWIAARFNNISSVAGFWTVTTGGTSSGTSFTISPIALPLSNAADIVVSLTGSGTAWDGTTVITATGVSGTSCGSVNVTSGTAATVICTTGATSGTLTLTESVTGSAVATVPVSSGGGTHAFVGSGG